MKKVYWTQHLELIQETTVFFISIQTLWLYFLLMNKFFDLWINSITNELIPIFNLVYPMIFIPFFYYIILLIYFFNFTSIMKNTTIFKTIKFFSFTFIISTLFYLLFAFLFWDIWFLFPIWELLIEHRFIILFFIFISWIISFGLFIND